jgi:hypothetical protein
MSGTEEKPFSERHGFAPWPTEITVRHEAPAALRGLSSISRIEPVWDLKPYERSYAIS